MSTLTRCRRTSSSPGERARTTSSGPGGLDRRRSTSPTYAGVGPGTSPYGRVTSFFSSPLILTLAQAQAAADTILAQNVGAGATYTITRPYDPTVTAGDTVAWNGSTYAVDAITVDLTGETALQVRELGS